VGLYDRDKITLLRRHWGCTEAKFIVPDYGIKSTIVEMSNQRFSRSKDSFILKIIAKLSDWIQNFWNKLKLLFGADWIE
jgi:hypothetical protein